jgi:dsDNA-specific endonuclease/ATPase MutS2
MKRIPIEDAFDLHSFQPRDVVSAVSDYLEEAWRAGYREVRLIHGKGTGARRAEVRRFLSTRADVADFFDAPPERGGSGATIVILAAPGGAGS